MKISRENVQFIRLLIGISIPIAMQQLISNALNMLDILMIGQLGDVQITGVGLANQIFFLFTLICFGINSGAAIFMAQFWGRKDIDGIHKIMGICFFLSSFTAIVFMLGGMLIPEKLLSIYSNDIDVIKIGADYLKIVVVSYLFNAVATVFSFAMRSTGEARTPMLVSILSLFTNGILNYILIFGAFGIPALGVVGAALATLISRIIEIIVLCLIIYKKKMPIATSIKKYFSFNMKFVNAYFATAGLVILNEFVWALGTSLYNVGYKFAGTQAQTAVQIASNVQNMAFVVSMGIGNAAGIMLGNLLGAGKTDMAEKYYVKLTKVTIGIGICMGAILIVSIPPIVSIFNVTPIVRDYTMKILVAVSLFLPFKCINHLYVVGVLRSGGDTLATLLLDAGGVWLIGVPMAFLGTLVFGLPIHYVCALVYSEEIVKMIFSILRVRTKKWIKGISV